MTSKKKNKSNIFVDLLNGNILARDFVIRQLPFLFFIAFLLLVNIANGYMAEGAIRRLNKVNNEIKELRSEYITTKSELMYKSKQSELASIIDSKGLGLKESIEPPRKIILESTAKIDFEK